MEPYENVQELEVEVVPEAPKPDYVWPQKVAGSAPTGAPARTPKIGRVDPNKQFITNQNGEKQVWVGQYTYPRSGKAFDQDEWINRLRQNNIAPIGQLFPDAPNYCERGGCWEISPAGDAFCSRRCRNDAMNGADRFMRF